MLIFATLEDPDERKLCETLYKTYRARMFRVARAILHSDADAEDAVCDTFEKIIKNISKFSPLSGDETARLIVIYIRSAAITLYRRKKKISFDELDESGLSDNFGVEDFVLSAVAVEKLRREIERLDPIYRDTLTLKHIYGYSDSELAALYGIGEGAVRMRLMRAKNRLYQALKEDGEGK